MLIDLYPRLISSIMRSSVLSMIKIVIHVDLNFDHRTPD